MSFLTNELEGALAGAARGFLLRSLIIDLAIVKEKIILQGEFFNHLWGFAVLPTLFMPHSGNTDLLGNPNPLSKKFLFDADVELQIELERKKQWLLMIFPRDIGRKSDCQSHSRGYNMDKKHIILIYLLAQKKSRFCLTW